MDPKSRNISKGLSRHMNLSERTVNNWNVDHQSNMNMLVGWLLEFHILATYNLMSGRVPTCDRAHSWQIA